MMDKQNPRAGKGARAGVSMRIDSQHNTTSDHDHITFLDAERAVQVTRSDGGLFMVTIDPVHPDYPPQTFESYKAARGFAGGVRLCTRWPIIDEAEGAL